MITAEDAKLNSIECAKSKIRKNWAEDLEYINDRIIDTSNAGLFNCDISRSEIKSEEFDSLVKKLKGLGYKAKCAEDGPLIIKW